MEVRIPEGAYFDGGPNRLRDVAGGVVNLLEALNLGSEYCDTKD